MAIRQAPTNNRGGFLQGERSRKFMEVGKKKKSGDYSEERR